VENIENRDRGDLAQFVFKVPSLGTGYQVLGTSFLLGFLLNLHPHLLSSPKFRYWGWVLGTGYLLGFFLKLHPHLSPPPPQGEENTNFRMSSFLPRWEKERMRGRMGVNEGE